MSQSKMGSFIESCLNIGSGFIVALIIATVFFPLFGINKPFMENAALVGIFTVASVIRSYIWRRIFNRRLVRQMQQGTRT